MSKDDRPGAPIPKRMKGWVLLDQEGEIWAERSSTEAGDVTAIGFYLHEAEAGAAAEHERFRFAPATLEWGPPVERRKA